MTRIFGIMIVCVAGMMLAGCAATQAQNQKMISAARLVDEHFVSAYNRGDIDGLMSNYWNSPELIVYPPMALETKGWNAVKAGISQGLVSSPGARINFVDSRYQVIGDAVICSGKWRMTLPSKDGFPFVVEGRYTDIKAERNGKWVIIIDHASIPWPFAP